MVKLAREDIRTEEVLGWKGLHLLHFRGSSCSQKTRIAFAEMGVDWESHHVDIGANENFTPWFMGINPRGLVPILVHDGDVHIESNDIIEYVDGISGGGTLFPPDPSERSEMLKLMQYEDDLHLCVRVLTFRYFMPVEKMRKPDAAVDIYEAEGAQTVGGAVDGRKAIEVRFWRNMNANGGITDDQVVEAADEFTKAFETLEARLERHEWLLPSGFSAADIAWWITVYRIAKMGFPLDRFPKLKVWHDTLLAREHFAREVALPPPVVEISQAHQAACAAAGQSMTDVMAAHGR